MNWSLFRSWHGILAASVVVACCAWHLLVGERFGSREHVNAAFLLATGWLGVLAYIVLALYAARKAAHRSGLSPEFCMRVPVHALEQAQSALTGLQNRIRARELVGRRSILRAVRRILSEQGVHRVLRVRITKDQEVLGGFRLTALPREPLGRLAGWMHAHLYYGAAAGLIVWFHGGMRSGSTMGLLLNVLSYSVVLTGLFGVVMWTLGPTWLSRREREVQTEKAFVLRAHYNRKLRALCDELAKDEGTAILVEAAQALAGGARLTERQAASLRAGATERGRARDLLVLIGQRESVEQHWRHLNRLLRLFNAWRLVHVPCSIVLMALVVVHVFRVWRY